MFNSPHLLIILNSKQPDISIVFYKQSVNLYEALRKDIHKLPCETQETYLIETYSVTNILAARVTNTDDRLPKTPPSSASDSPKARAISFWTVDGVWV